MTSAIFDDRETTDFHDTEKRIEMRGKNAQVLVVISASTLAIVTSSPETFVGVHETTVTASGVGG